MSYETMRSSIRVLTPLLLAVLNMLQLHLARMQDPRQVGACRRLSVSSWMSPLTAGLSPKPDAPEPGPRTRMTSQ